MARRKKSVFVLACFLVMGFMASLIVGGCIPLRATLSQANTEAEFVKTAALNFFEDHGVWPETSNNLTPTYIAGTLKAMYDIDDDYGWLLSASNVTWSGIEFTGGVAGPTGQHGQWVGK